MLRILGKLKSSFGHARALATSKRRNLVKRPSLDMLESRYLLSITINFENLSQNTLVNTSYDALGADFAGATVITESGSLSTAFPPHSGTNVVDDRTGPIKVSASAGTSWSEVGGYITGNKKIVMTAYQANGTVVGTASTNGANYIGSGTGLSPNMKLDIKGSNIAYVKFVGNANGGADFTLDDFFFSSPATVEINNTAATSDNITVFNSDATGEHLAQMIPVMITNNTTTTQTFQLLVNPSTDATLSQTSVTLAAGASTGTKGIPAVIITPTADSTTANDVHIVAKLNGVKVSDDQMTIVSVILAHGNGTTSLDVKKGDTPTGMPDRIPPRVPTMEDVTVAPDLTGSGESVTLAVTGQSSTNGIVTINGQSTPQVITSSGTVDLSSPDGTTQTAPGHGGNLLFTVEAHGVNAVQSNGFSVSAIPVNFSISLSSLPPHAGFTGYVAHVTWSSDSGTQYYSDLSDDLLLEQVAIASNDNKVFKYFPPIKNQTVPGSAAASTGGTDEHSINNAFLTTPGGEIVFDQVFTFEDMRTLSLVKSPQVFFAAPNAGFVIDNVVKFDPKSNKWKIAITTEGMLATANNFTSEAGIGSISETLPG